MIAVKVQALLLAERVYEDATSHNKIIAGTFNRIFVKGFGQFAGPYWVYCAMTGLRGTTAVALRIVDLTDDSTLAATGGFAIESPDPNHLTELVVPVPVPAPHAGIFCLEVLQQDVVIGSLRFGIEAQSEG